VDPNNSSDDGKSPDEEPSSDEFASSDESFEQDVWPLVTQVVKMWASTTHPVTGSRRMRRPSSNESFELRQTTKEKLILRAQVIIVYKVKERV